jgi:hypothetical protein
MIYRKAPPQPTRLLLRIVAGAGALMGATACGSGTRINGSVILPDEVGADAETSDARVVMGVAPAPSGNDSGEEASTVGGGVSPCHPCGAVAIPPEDSGTDASEVHGVVPFDDGGVLGVVAMPGGGIQPAPDDAGKDQ